MITHKEITLFEEKLMTPSIPIQKEAYKMLVDKKELKEAVYEKYVPIIGQAVDKKSAKPIYDCLKSIFDNLYIPEPDKSWDILDLSKMKGEKLKSLSKEFFEFPLLQNIWQLDVSKHEIESIDPSIGNLKKLKRIVITDNHLKELPESILKIGSLEELIVSGNELETLTSELLNASKLEYLNISYNDFSQLPLVVYEMKSLTGISLGGNKKIREISEGISKLINLRELSMQGCAIKKLPDAFWTLESLMYLNFSDSGIEEISDQVFELPKLKSLDLTGCTLSDERKYELAVKLGDVVKGVNLKAEPFLSLKVRKASEGKSTLDKELDLIEQKMINGNKTKRNEIKNNIKSSKELTEKIRERYDFVLRQLSKKITDKRLPSVIEKILISVETNDEGDRWKSMDLSELKETITELDDCFFESEYIKQLESLDLSNHNVTVISEKVGQCSNLKNLCLYGNKLDQLPDGLEYATSLKYLNLHNNSLSELSEQLLQLKKIEEINIGGNKEMKALPKVILKMKQLKILEMALNIGMEELPKEIILLENLEYLSCFMSGITNIPDELWKLKHINYVDLGGTKVVDLSDSVKDCTSLERLVLEETSMNEAREKELEEMLDYKVYY